MKRNKRRMEARLKPYIWGRIEAIAAKTESTYTEVIEEALEKGLNWLIKKIRKELDPNFLNGEKKQDQAQEQENNKYEEEQRQGNEALNKLGMTQEEAIKISKTKWVDDEE